MSKSSVLKLNDPAIFCKNLKHSPLGEINTQFSPSLHYNDSQAAHSDGPPENPENMTTVYSFDFNTRSPQRSRMKMQP